MATGDNLTGVTLAIAFITQSDDVRFMIAVYHLDELLRFVRESTGAEREVALMVSMSAVAMYLRYIADVALLTDLFYSITRRDLPSDEQQLAELHREIAGHAGYPMEAAKRMFNALVPDQQALYDIHVLRKPEDKLSRKPVEEAAIAVLELGQWEKTALGPPTEVPPHFVRILIRLLCCGGNRSSRIVYNASGQRRSVLETTHGDHAEGDMGYCVRELSKVVQQLTAAASPGNRLHAATGAPATSTAE
ncbi:hypothetical protein GGF50DRAFT_131847 [Schizophyllum commune]